MTIKDDDSWRDEVADEDPSEATGKRPLRVVTERETRPDIPIVPDVHLTTDAMVKVLATDPEVYSRGGVLVHVLRASTDDETRTAGALVAGTPVVREMPLSFGIDRVSLRARCVKRCRKKDGSWYASHIPPPSGSVKAALERGYWPGVRPLRGVVEAPSMRPDGSIIQDAGYDRATGFLYEPNARFPRVPDRPTHGDAARAYAHLSEPFREFPYKEESHRSAVVAAILTLVARPAILGAVPCFLFDASAARSGKSLQVDVINLIATGRSASRVTYPEQDEELEKVLASFALRGAPTVNFDNVARRFGGAALDKVITAVDEVDIRILGSSEIRTLEWRAVMLASGNNVMCRGDMLPRVLSPRLETRLDNPELMTPTIPDLRAWVRERRAELVVDALTLLRAYIIAGRPHMGLPRWGGFEAWTAFVPQALVWAGAPDPMGARRGLAGDNDPEAAAHSAFVDGWSRLCDEVNRLAGLTVKQALAHLYPPDRHERAPDAYGDLREVIEDVTNARPGFAPSARALGDRLRRWRDKPVGGRKLVGASAERGVARWRVTPS